MMDTHGTHPLNGDVVATRRLMVLYRTATRQSITSTVGALTQGDRREWT